MRRFLVLYALLLVTGVVFTLGFSYRVLHNLDLRYSAFLSVVLAPAAQAALVALTLPRQGLSLADAAKGTWRRKGIVLLLGLSALTIAALQLATKPPSRLGGVLAYLVGILAAAAGALFLARGGRLVAALLGLVLLGVAIEAFRPWLGPLPGRVLLSWPPVIRWAVIYGCAFFLAVVVAACAAVRLRTSAPLAAEHLEAAVLFAFLAALVAVPGYYLRSYLLDPWGRVLGALVALAVTFCLSAALLLRERT
jgi:hypothetical protein